MLKYALTALVAGVALSFGGCSSDDGNSSDDDGSGGATGGSGGTSGSIGVTGGSSGTSGSGDSGSSVIISSDGGRCVLSDNNTGCVGESYSPEIIPLDIYIMFDQTGSTLSCVDPPDATTNCNLTRIDAIRQAATAFLQDSESAGIGLGIGYFGHLPLGQASCDPADYDDPAVGIAVLPGNADPIIQSLNSVVPTGETPSGAAIRGACTYASQWKASHPGHETVILLLTDGRPEAPVTCQGGAGPCCPTLEDTIAAALACREGTPAVKTYVLGVGPFLQNLEQIAVAGGTEKAYLVEGGDVAQNVLNALRSIRGAAQVPCNLQMPPPPPGTALNPDLVNVAYADQACDGTILGRVDDVATCDNTGGWYYDDPANPQTVHLCPTSCDRVSVPGTHFLFSVGCRTVEVPK